MEAMESKLHSELGLTQWTGIVSFLFQNALGIDSNDVTVAKGSEIGLSPNNSVQQGTYIYFV